MFIAPNCTDPFCMFSIHCLWFLLGLLRFLTSPYILHVGSHSCSCQNGTSCSVLRSFPYGYWERSAGNMDTLWYTTYSIFEEIVYTSARFLVVPVTKPVWLHCCSADSPLLWSTWPGPCELLWVVFYIYGLFLPCASCTCSVAVSCFPLCRSGFEIPFVCCYTVLILGFKRSYGVVGV